MRILYFSDIDMTVPDGPSVNEQVFCKTLLETFPDTRFVLPQNNTKLAFLRNENTLFYPAPKKKILSPAYWLHAIKTAYAVKKEYKAHNVDLVVSRMTLLPLALFLLTGLFKIPVVLKSQGKFWFDKSHVPPKDKLYLSINEYISFGSIKNCKGLDTVSPQARTAIEKSAPNVKITVIENSTNVEDFSPEKTRRIYKEHDLSAFDRVIGYAGSFPSERGLVQLMTFAQNNQDRNFGYLIAGYDDKTAAIKQKIDDKNLGQHFIFTGHVPYTDIPAVLSCIDIGVSFDDVERAKTIGNSSQKVRQYLSAGCPCISIDIGNDFLKDGDLGTLVSPDDDAAIAAAILHWHNRITEEGQALRTRLHQYATQHLSAQAALKQRLAFWEGL